MYYCTPISLSSVLLSYLKEISDCTACKKFIVFVVVVAIVAAVAIRLKVAVTFDYLICQETTIRGK